jgi:hypothetical protein
MYSVEKHFTLIRVGPQRKVRLADMAFMEHTDHMSFRQGCGVFALPQHPVQFLINTGVSAESSSFSLSILCDVVALWPIQSGRYNSGSMRTADANSFNIYPALRPRRLVHVPKTVRSPYCTLASQSNAQIHVADKAVFRPLGEFAAIRGPTF